ncbi:MAG: hypothetical protein NVSMB23_26790 [Myxococcales bacterium]
MIAYLILFAAGAVLGTALDHIHVATAVLAYPAPFAFAQALWVPPLFGFAAVSFVRMWQPLRSTADRRPSPARVVSAFVIFAAAYAVTGLAHHSDLFVWAVLLPAWIALIAGPGWKRRALYGLVVAASGTAFESGLCWLGGFHYLVPTRLRVPTWLPVLYLHASLLLRQLDLAFFAPAAGALPAGRRPGTQALAPASAPIRA